MSRTDIWTLRSGWHQLIAHSPSPKPQAESDTGDSSTGLPQLPREQHRRWGWDESSSGSRPPKLAPAERGGSKERRGAEVGQSGDLEAQAGRTLFFPWPPRLVPVQHVSTTPLGKSTSTMKCGLCSYISKSYSDGPSWKELQKWLSKKVIWVNGPWAPEMILDMRWQTWIFWQPWAYRRDPPHPLSKAAGSTSGWPLPSISLPKTVLFTGFHLSPRIYVTGCWWLLTLVFCLPGLGKRVVTYYAAGRMAHLHLRKTKRNLTLVSFIPLAFASVP